MLEGDLHPDFGEVATVFGRCLPRDRAGGGAVCVYHEGECVADLWGGSRDAEGNPWERSTLALSFSTTKGVLSTLVHMQVDRGHLGYDEPVAKRWPEFEAAGKQDIRVRHLLTHEAGLYNVRDLIDDASRMLDWRFMVRSLARTSPAHTPGAAHGYHGLTFGWLVGELLERVTGKTIAELLDQELAGPLGLDGLYVGIDPSALPRVATLVDRPVPTREPHRPSRSSDKPSLGARLLRLLRTLGFPIDPSRFSQALLPSGMGRFDWNAPEVLRACIPAANGVFTARSLARVYAALAEGGTLDGVQLVHPATLETMMQVQNRGLDRVVPLPMAWRLGYHRVFSLRPRMPRAFGHFGLGGSGAFADPSRRLAVAFTTNCGSGSPFGDARMIRIAGAAARCVAQR